MLAQLELLALQAAKIILRSRQSGPSLDLKSDGSPVTDADRLAENWIVQGLGELDPSIPIIAEERVHAGHAPATEQRFFLVDALDGTKEFIKGRPDFTVNICLVDGGTPRLGVVAAPARNELFSGNGQRAYRCRLSPDGAIVERDDIRTSTPCNELTAVASASHACVATKNFLAKFAVGKMLAVGSSLKFCLLAAGEADLYPRMGRTMQWDTAAGDAVLRSAGGCTLRLDGGHLCYGVNDAGTDAFANPPFVSFAGGTDALRSMLKTSAVCSVPAPS
jgi:3'(2'), 5'-bisphosphate nucleotidase